MVSLSFLRRAIVIHICAALILVSPGFAPYEALAGEFSTRGAAASLGAHPAQKSIPPLAISALGASGPSSLDSLKTAPGVALPTMMTSASQQAPASSPASLSAARQTSDLSRSVAQTIEPLGAISQAAPDKASSAGQNIQDIMAGGRTSPHASDVPVTPSASMGSLPGPHLSYANPAGRESISAAAKAHFGGGSSFDRGNDKPEPAPLLPRLLSAALASLPAVLLGWPLLTAGSPIAGGLTIAASLGVAALPFISETAPVVLRQLPGVAIGALGLATLASGFQVHATGMKAMGALVTIGAWGFLRFARGNRRSDTPEVIATFFGALGAVAGAGLALLSPPGLIAQGLTVLAYPVTLSLYAHLPGWVGAAFKNAWQALWASLSDAHHVFSALRHDTVAAKRLVAYTAASLKVSPWNAIWLGTLIWLPVLAMELFFNLLGIADGLLLGALRAPVMALWGASHELAPHSSITRFLAGWARASFWANKPGLFNQYEKRLIPIINAPDLFNRARGAMLMRLLQISWLGISLLWTALGSVFGLVDGFAETGKPYDEKSHDPRNFSLGTDELPSQVPSVSEPSATLSLPGKLVATAIGLSPLYFFAGPLFTTGFLGWGALGAALSIGLMPMMPSSSKFPLELRKLPATLLTLTGIGSAIGAARMILFVGLPTGWILPLGVLAAFCGWGLGALIDTLLDPKTSAWKINSGLFVGGFASSLALSTALDAALLGTEGILMTALGIAAVTLSPILLYHLPRWLWRGVGSALFGIPSAMSSVHRVMSFWRKDTQFENHLSQWFNYWTRKSFWYGAVFIAPWAVILASCLVEAVVAVAAGLAVSLVRLPTLFALGAARGADPTSAATAFWRHFNDYLADYAENSKKTIFDPRVANLIPSMNKKVEPSSRPTLNAAGTVLLAWVVEIFWVIRLLALTALTPLLWPLAAWNARNAAPKTPPAE